MSFIIPLTSEPIQNFKVSALNDVDYYFRIQWNERSEFWTLDILTAAQTLIIAGLVLRADNSLLTQYSNELLPTGELKVIDQSGAGLDPTADDLGERVVLYYEPSS
jgi:hypothetical protein